MNPKEFLIKELRNLAKNFPGVSFRYEHNSSFKEHIIEVSPESTYKFDDAYGEAEFTISKQMILLFPMETVAFVGADSLIKVKNVTEIIPAVISNWNSCLSNLLNNKQFNSSDLHQIIAGNNDSYALAA